MTNLLITHKYIIARYVSVDITKLGVFQGWRYYKVPVIGIMTSNNVGLACKNANLSTPCPAPTGCLRSDENCIATGLDDCDNPMREVSKAICNGEDPTNCPDFDGVYAYDASLQSGSACGVEEGQWCVHGNNYTNKNAFCAAREGWNYTLFRS